jgi:glycosyltransferase involved in cell wall biosynthesis
MQVVILPSWYYSPGTSPIAGILFHEHALELRKHGIDAQVAYAGYASNSFHSIRSAYTLENDVPTWRGTGWFPPKIHPQIIKWWIRKCGTALIEHFQSHASPHIIHAQGYQAGWIAEFVFHNTGIPYIITEHYSGFLQENIPISHKPFIRSALNTARQVTAVSPGLKDAMTHYTDADILVVPNDYNPEVFFTDPSHRKAEAFQFVSVGEPIYTKGLDILIEAFYHLVNVIPNQKFRLVLADKIPYQHVLERIAKQFGVADKIDFRGLLTPKEVASLYHQSHVLVSSSRFETFGKTMVEANACGIPVVATKTAGSTYILQSEKQGILCEQGSVEWLAKAMIQMYRQYDTFDSTEISTSVSTRFSRQILLQQWIRLYKECVHDS